MKKQKLFLLALFTIIWPALSILNCQFSILKAQTFVVVDKNGNKVSYDVSKIEKVTFQEDPPGFTVFETKEAPSQGGEDPNPGQGGEQPTVPVIEQTTYTFEEVQTFSGDPDFLFSHPDTVYVGADGQDFKFQLRTNVDYGYKPSADWLRFKAEYADADSLSFTATMNPSTSRRIGYLYFQSNDAKMCDTLVVVQSGKRDSRYIDIDWSKTTLDSYNKETGRAVLTFQDDVPVMGDHDVMLLPGTETYSIRIIDDVQQAEGSKTVTLDTREGKMGNLFKDQQFTLCSDPNYDPSESSSEGGTTPKPSYAPSISGPIIYPESIELCENGRPVMEVYNRVRRSKLEKEYNIFEYKYDNSGSVIWEKGANKVSWNTCTFDVGLKGIFSFDFGNVAWENVRFGDLQNFKAYLDGDFNTDLILQYELTKGVEAKYEKTLKKDIFSYRVKFMVGTIPVWINLKSDLKASVEAKAEGTVAVTGGVRASANLKGGVEWDTNRGVNPISSFDYQYELVSPEVTAEAHAEAKAYVWPEINIGIYDVLCPTINPKPYIRAYADARTAEANKPFFGWNAGVSTGVDLTLGLNLDLYFWKKEIGEIDPINLIDYDLVAVPTKIEIDDSRLTRNVMKGDTCHVKYRVKGYNRITGSEYNIPLACVKIEKDGGGEIDSEQWKGADYFYTNRNGEIDVVYTQTDTIPATLKATLITGDEERDKEAKEWKTILYDYRLTAQDIDASDNSITATLNGIAEAKFLFEQYVKNDAEADGQWYGLSDTEVKFEASNGSLEAATVKTDSEGFAIAKFDGGRGFGGGSLTANVYIEQFDTTYTQKIIIHKFTFADADLAKCYNLANNTANLNGDIFEVRDILEGDIPSISRNNRVELNDWWVWNNGGYEPAKSVMVTLNAIKDYGESGPVVLRVDTTYESSGGVHHDIETHRKYKQCLDELSFECKREEIVYWNSDYEDGKESDYGFTRRMDGGIYTSIKNDYRYVFTPDEGAPSVTEGTTTYNNWANPESKAFRDATWMERNCYGKVFAFQENETIVILVCLIQQGKSSMEYWGIKDPADQKLYLKAVFAKDDPHLFGYDKCYGNQDDDEEDE